MWIHSVNVLIVSISFGKWKTSKTTTWSKNMNHPGPAVSTSWWLTGWTLGVTQESHLFGNEDHSLLVLMMKLQLCGVLQEREDNWFLDLVSFLCPILNECIQFLNFFPNALCKMTKPIHKSKRSFKVGNDFLIAHGIIANEGEGCLWTSTCQKRGSSWHKFIHGNEIDISFSDKPIGHIALSTSRLTKNNYVTNLWVALRSQSRLKTTKKGKLSMERLAYSSTMISFWCTTRSSM